MRIAIVAVAQRPPRWAEDACADYLARLPGDFAPRVIEVKPEPRDGRPVERVLAAEAQRLRAAIPPGYAVVVLDERGKEMTTRALAQWLRENRDAAQPVAFVIGGPDGIDAEFKRSARLQLRLSALTLPHALARVVLAEQLYRVWSILAHHPYHRD
ncbi:MAG TPA: 23S rRNA (pseudouridine(1915)-N(3))-methyltransferase RlmH [Burkholderiaceae bacterium]|jgi:23S rRNA (pseudouridine1915-N3)-methyltransferase|nr:23S rRNA (pseudouridine(1915)-N(3))-methyltransferase RlmH [Burkholderiaceae bacterium]